MRTLNVIEVRYQDIGKRLFAAAGIWKARHDDPF
jgi:hypothetical protein